MKHLLHLILSSLCFGIFYSCVTITPVVSKKIETPSNNQTSDFCNLFDSSTKIRYGIGNNDSILYLRMEILDEDIARKVIRNGLYVYFDETGKKKKDLALNFPMEDQPKEMKNMGNSNQKPPMTRDNNSKSQPTKSNAPSIDDLMETVSEKAEWIVYEDSYQFNWKLEKSPFSVKITKGDIDQLIYEAYIPLSQFLMHPENNSFSLGVEIGKENSGPKGSGEGMEMSNNEMGGGMPGGGMPGGGMPSGGMPGGGMPGGNGNNQSGNNTTSSQSFWALVSLTR